MEFSVVEQPDEAVVMITPDSIACDGTAHTVTVVAQVKKTAPLGSFTFNIKAEGPADTDCEEIITPFTVNVCDCVDLDFPGLDDSVEFLAPGGFLCVNDDDDDNDNGVPDKDETGPVADENDLMPLSLYVNPGLDATGTVELKVLTGASYVKLYLDSNRSTPLTLPATWSPGDSKAGR